MAASMKGLDPVLKRYLRTNKLPDVYEVACLLSFLYNRPLAELLYTVVAFALQTLSLYSDCLVKSGREKTSFTGKFFLQEN